MLFKSIDRNFIEKLHNKSLKKLLRDIILKLNYNIAKTKSYCSIKIKITHIVLKSEQLILYQTIVKYCINML